MYFKHFEINSIHLAYFKKVILLCKEDRCCTISKKKTCQNCKNNIYVQELSV